MRRDDIVNPMIQGQFAVATDGTSFTTMPSAPSFVFSFLVLFAKLSNLGLMAGAVDFAARPLPLPPAAPAAATPPPFRHKFAR